MSWEIILTMSGIRRVYYDSDVLTNVYAFLLKCQSNKSFNYNESFRDSIVGVIDGKLVDRNFPIQPNVSFSKQANISRSITQAGFAIDETIFSSLI